MSLRRNAFCCMRFLRYFSTTSVVSVLLNHAHHQNQQFQFFLLTMPARPDPLILDTICDATTRDDRDDRQRAIMTRGIVTTTVM